MIELSQMEDSELCEVLEAGLTSAFWRWFVSYVQREWGPQGTRYQRKMDEALNLTDNHAAASQARQVRSGQMVILGLLTAPQLELRRLKDLAATSNPNPPLPASRSAPRLDEDMMAHESRRGGL